MTTLGTSQRGRTPTGVKVAPMSYDKLEDVANELRPLLPTVPGSSGAWFIDCGKVLEDTLARAKFGYYIAATSELAEIAAFTIPDERLIVLREDVYDGLYRDEPFSRSTVIHELAHIVLNHAVTFNRGAPYGEHRFYEDSEWQAKALTAAIMMPIQACATCASHYELSHRCGTSTQAAQYRIQKLGERGKLDISRYT